MASHVEPARGGNNAPTQLRVEFSYAPVPPHEHQNTTDPERMFAELAEVEEFRAYVRYANIVTRKESRDALQNIVDDPVVSVISLIFSIEDTPRASSPRGID